MSIPIVTRNFWWFLFFLDIFYSRLHPLEVIFVEC